MLYTIARLWPRDQKRKQNKEGLLIFTPESATSSSSSVHHLHAFCTCKETKILWGAMSSSEKFCMWAGCCNYCYSIVLIPNNNETKSMNKCLLQCTSENNLCTTFILYSHRCRHPSQKEEGCRQPLTCNKGALRASAKRARTANAPEMMVCWVALASHNNILQFYSLLYVTWLEWAFVNPNRSKFIAVSTSKLNKNPSLLLTKTCIFLSPSVSILQLWPRKICSVTMQSWQLLLKEANFYLTSSMTTEGLFPSIFEHLHYMKIYNYTLFYSNI